MELVPNRMFLKAGHITDEKIDIQYVSLGVDRQWLTQEQLISMS